MKKTSAKAKKPSAVERKLATLTKKTLGGRVPTEELAAFWSYKLKAKKDAFFHDPAFGEVELVSKEPDGADHYTSSADGEAWAALFADIAWLGEEADGGLIGYYHRGAAALDGAPVVYLDNEGSLILTATSLVDHFAWRKGKPLDLLEQFCSEAKLPLPLTTKQRKASVKKLPSPEARYQELEKALASARGPAGRPVDRHPTAVKLGDGRVLLISSDDDVTKRKEWDANVAFVYDSVLGRFSLVAETPFRMYLNAEAAGSNGKAVVAKVEGENQVALYDPEAGSWKAGAVFEAQHAYAAAALLANGRVVIGGGERSYPYMSDAVSVYDPAKDKWSSGGKLSKARSHPAAIAVPDGRVLFLGGTSMEDDADYPSESSVCDAFDAKKRKCTQIASMPRPMDQPRATLLADGRVAVAGQCGLFAIYDPRKNKWSKAVEDDRISNTFVQLDDGQLAFFSGQNVTLCAPKTLKLTEGGTTLLPRNNSSAAVVVGDGQVLVVGGDLFNNIASEPELWDPRTREGRPLPGFDKPLARQVRKLAKHLSK